MSRDLLGLVLLAVLCICISPFYKEANIVKPQVKPQVKLQDITVTPSITQTEYPKTIVFLSDTFLPKTFAGSELSGYETLKFLRDKGHTCKLFL